MDKATCPHCKGNDTERFGLSSSRNENAPEILNLAYCHECDTEFSVPISVHDLTEERIKELLGLE